MFQRETPRLTLHARHRCAEMGISTKVAKRIVQDASVTRPCNVGVKTHCRIMVSDAYPDYAVVYDPILGIVVTVLFRTVDDYLRDGTTYKVEPRS
jgi:hypothetical protein